MNIYIEKIKKFKFLKKIIRKIFGLISMLTRKNNNLILFYGTTLQTYNENSRYLFEFISRNSNLDCYWVTNNQLLIEYLKNQNLKSFNIKSLLSVWIHLRAKIIISTETSYPNFLGLVGGKTLKYCLHHGFGPRTTNMPDGEMFKTQLDVIKSINEYSYFTFSSKYSKILIGNMLLHLADSKCSLNGMPRCDHLLNNNIVQQLKINKNISCQYFNLNSESKIILYAPTWRQENNNDFMLLTNKNISEIDFLLKQYNMFLFLSYHELTSNCLDLNGISNIKILVKDYLFDINLFLPEVDLLITDYSSIITDFLLLENRTIAFYVPDLEYYQYVYGLNMLFKPDKFGNIIVDTDSFKEFLSKFACGGNADIWKVSKNEYLEMFYDTTIKNSCKRHMDFIITVIEKDI